MNTAQLSMPSRTPDGTPYWSFSLFIPGMGQFCQFRIGPGLFWLLLSPTLYVLAGPWGVIPHLLSVLDAFLARNRPIRPYPK